MNRCEDCLRPFCRRCGIHYCGELCPCGNRDHNCDCDCGVFGADEKPLVQQEGEQWRCGYTKRHPSHTFMRLEVLFQCPGEYGTEGEL